MLPTAEFRALQEKFLKTGHCLELHSIADGSYLIFSREDGEQLTTKPVDSVEVTNIAAQLEVMEQLAALNKTVNDGNGSSVARTVLLHLSRLQFQQAAETVYYEFDKIRQYPELVNFFEGKGISSRKN